MGPNSHINLNSLEEEQQLPSSVRTGVLYVDKPAPFADPVTNKITYVKTPIYVLDWYHNPQGGDSLEDDLIFAFTPVYKRLETGELDVGKAKESHTVAIYDKTSKLGLALGNPPTLTQVTTKPPVFIAPVTLGVDTFTHQQGKGFYERTPDKFSAGNGNLMPGKNTNIFVGLESIKWSEPNYLVGPNRKDYDQLLSTWFGVI